MRRLVITSLLALVPGSLVGCGGDDPSPLFADVQWQIQCRCMGMCSGIPGRDINHLDGEEGHRVACEVFSRGDRSVLTASAFQGSSYGIEIRDAEFPPGGGPVSGSGCTVRVVESGNEYRAACGANPPSESQPCRISELMETEDEDGNPQIQGKLVCAGLPATAGSMTVRELTFPRASVDSTMCPFPTPDPAQFRFVNCRGL